MRGPDALKAWYLSVVDGLAQDGAVETASVRGFWWREIDSPEDLEEAQQSFSARLGTLEDAPAVAAARG